MQISYTKVENFGWGGGGELEYHKSMGEPQKRGEANFEISVGVSKKGWNTLFDSNLARGKILEETMIK